MLALERKATVSKDGSVNIRAQPFGGAVRILDPTSLQELIGEIRFDCERSKHEQDFRILIPPSKWESVKGYCLRRLENLDDIELESLPHRELEEEFARAIGVNLDSDRYTVQPLGFVVEDQPVATDNAEARGQLTVRLYRTFEARIIDVPLCMTMLAASQQRSDQELGRLALEDSKNGGKGRANSMLALPLNRVIESYLALPPDLRYQKVVVEGHELDESVLAILGDIEVPQYQRI
jgi:hypothetical protein